MKPKVTLSNYGKYSLLFESQSDAEEAAIQISLFHDLRGMLQELMPYARHYGQTKRGEEILRRCLNADAAKSIR